MSGKRTRATRVALAKRGNDNRVRTYGRYKMDDNQVEVLAIKYRDLLLQHHKWEREVKHLKETKRKMIQILDRLSRKDLVEFNAMDFIRHSLNSKGN